MAAYDIREERGNMSSIHETASELEGLMTNPSYKNNQAGAGVRPSGGKQETSAKAEGDPFEGKGRGKMAKMKKK